MPPERKLNFKNLKINYIFSENVKFSEIAAMIISLIEFCNGTCNSLPVNLNFKILAKHLGGTGGIT